MQKAGRNVKLGEAHRCGLSPSVNVGNLPENVVFGLARIWWFDRFHLGFQQTSSLLCPSVQTTSEAAMTERETLILLFLRGSPEEYFGRKEIARKAVKRREFEEDPHWVDAPLASLLVQGMVEQNHSGQYRITPSGASL
jgi:hypothetical protein